MTHRTLVKFSVLVALGMNLVSVETHVPLSAQQARRSSAPAGQTITRLADGRWLIVGGEEAPGQASIWDPATGTIAPTAGTPFLARAWHAATLLADATVLLTGGRNEAGYVDRPEIFEPATGTFTSLSIAGTSARASHTATLLLDGRVLITGGIGASSGPLQSEIWDVAGRAVIPIGAEPVDRAGHVATIAGDGAVILSGGRSLDGKPVSDRLAIDPDRGSLVRLAETPQHRAPATAPIVAAAIPAANATDVPTDAHVALRFSDAMSIESIDPASITLDGPGGTVATVVIAAEEGRLAFVWPAVALAEGATYVLKISGVVDRTGRPIVPASIRFTTTERTGSGQDAADGEAWTPDPRDPVNGWRTNRAPSPWESMAPLLAPPGVTAVSGRVLRLDGRPLAEVTLAIEAITARTDRTGRFLIQFTQWTSRKATLAIDARTANRPGRTYGVYEARIAVEAGRTNVLPFTIWSPRIDTAHQVDIPSPTATETLVTTPMIPGLEVHLPAGTVIRDEEREVVRTLSLTPIPLDRTPFPLPVEATFSMFFTIQPGGAYVSTPGPIPGAWIVYPNVRHSRVGSRVQFFDYDPDGKGWYPYGMGTITERAVVPDPKTRLYAFTGASFNDGTPTPPAGPPPGDCCNQDGDPVSLSTGIFTDEATDLVVPDVLPLVLTRHYNSQDPYARAFGPGMTHAYAVFMHSEQFPAEADFYQGDGGKIHFTRITDPALAYWQTVFEHAATPTPFYKARLAYWETLWDHGWTLSRLDGLVYTFHAGSPLQAMRDRFGNEIRLTYSATTPPQLQRVTSPNGRWIAFTYNAAGRVSQVADNIGRTVRYGYDANGFLETVTDPENHVTRYTWDATTARLLTVKPPRLQGTATNLVTNEYTTAADAPTPVGWVKKQTHVDGGVYQFSYSVTNGKSTQTTVTDPLQHQRRVTFNAAGYTLEDRRAVGQPEEQSDTSVRAGAGNLITASTNTHGDVTTTEYDSLGRVTRVVRVPGTADEAVTTYTYDPVWRSEIATITDPLNHVTTFEYDARGNRTSVIDALGHRTRMTYTLAGQVTAVTDPLQHTTTYEYAGGDLVTITDPLGRVTQRVVDAGGRLLTQTNPAGEVTRFAYDQLNQVTQVTDPLNGRTQFGSDTAGRLGSVTDALNHATSYGYDPFDRLASRTDPLGHTESFTYDLNGNPSQRTDRKSQVTTRSYDALNRLHQITYADTSTITYSYDAGNRLTAIADSVNGTITRTYDALDRLTSETTPQGTVSYTYDQADRRATMTVTGQPTVTYGYDAANRLTSVTQGSSTVTITYDDADRRRTLTLPNGIVASYGYDDATQLTSLTYTLGQTTLGTLTYTYDLAGRRTAVGGTWARTGLPQAVASATYDAANRIQSWAGQIFSFDPNGNLASDGLTSYTWDPRNQLASVSGPTSAIFQYDPLHRRVAKTGGGQTVQFLYDGGNSVQQLSNGTAMTTVLSSTSLDETWSRTDSVGARFPLTDGLGSTLTLTDLSGAALTQYTYDPFGTTQASGATATNPAQFTGRENDAPASDLYFYRARYVSTTTQRFVSEDPIEFAGGINLYAYTHNDPVNFVDPNGTCECSVDVKCRSVHDWRARIVGAVHCYFVVKGKDQQYVTLTAGPENNVLRSWAVAWNGGVDPTEGNGPGDQTVYRSVGASQTCKDVDCLKQKQGQFDALGLRYRSNRGPNSNTFVAWAARQCGLAVILPVSAIGRGADVP